MSFPFICFFFRYRRYRCPCFRTKFPCCSLTTPKGMKCPPSPVWVLRWAGHLWPYSYQVYGRRRCSARKELAMEKGKQKAGTTWKRYGKQKISIGSIGSLGNKLKQSKTSFFMNDLRRVRHCDSVESLWRDTHTYIYINGPTWKGEFGFWRVSQLTLRRYVVLFPTSKWSVRSPPRGNSDQQRWLKSFHQALGSESASPAAERRKEAAANVAWVVWNGEEAKG